MSDPKLKRGKRKRKECSPLMYCFVCEKKGCVEEIKDDMGYDLGFECVECGERYTYGEYSLFSQLSSRDEIIKKLGEYFQKIKDVENKECLSDSINIWCKEALSLIEKKGT